MLSLLGEMIDLERLARLPAARFTAGQAASTDRRSRRPEDGESWFANDDFVTETQPNLVRVETRPDGGKRYVLLDTDGPGAIVRIWTATTAGTLRIHIDGDATAGARSAGRGPAARRRSRPSWRRLRTSPRAGTTSTSRSRSRGTAW